MNENVRDVSQLLVRRGELGAPPEGAQTSHPVVVGGAAEERGVRVGMNSQRGDHSRHFILSEIA